MPANQRPNNQVGTPDYSRGFPAYPQTRTWQADHRRLVDDNEVPASQPGAAIRPAATSPDPPTMPNLTREAAVGSGPKAARIAEIARSLLGTPDSIYYPADPANSCASFVSTVLIKAGVMDKSGFTALAAGLTRSTERSGAVNVFGGPIPITPETVLRAQPGDVVQFIEPDHTIGHSGVSIGGGRVIAVSLHSGHVETYAINYRHSHYSHFQLHRFGN